MEFLHPAALFGLLALPLLLLPYLIRRKPRRLVFSSLLLFMDAGEQASRRPWGRIQVPWIFFLQLLLLTLLILALSEPVFSVRPTHIAIVLDNSASMQALEGGKTRFALAKEKANGLIGAVGVAGKVDLYVTTPRLEKVRAKSLTPAEANGAIASTEPFDLADPPADYDNLLNLLAREHKYERVYLITDHPARGQTAAIRVVQVGQAQANFAITQFDIQRSSLSNARSEAVIEVTSFSERDEKIKVRLKSGTNELASRDLVVSAGKSASVNIGGFADQPFYEAEIDIRDGLPLDNRRYAIAPASRSLRVLAISPRPRELESLKAIAGIQIEIVSPNDYEKSPRTDFGLEIFHFAAPAGLPQNSALFILPPESSSLVDLGAPFNDVNITNWRDPHTLTRYVNFNLFRPSYARPLKPQSVGEIVVESSKGPLAFSVERQGLRYLTLGFDPFPYLGRDNLPMSIFTLNLLDWFFESQGEKGRATGTPIPLGKAREGDRIVTPADKNIAAAPGANYFGGAFYQGIYQLRRNGEIERFARNLQDSNESDLRAPAPIELRSGAATSSETSVLFSFWPYLLIASLLLLMLEWFLNPRLASLKFWRLAKPVPQRP
ncbi:MAG: BatA protein [Deltaproteobacteria bacterium]|nr:BatA protein [Deltaproteobacteria bacterium]